ncbi:MAG: ABC transporter ATP-binding protein [Verrucomicrobia bacterium]|nr:ABC transporter ATP-binding protein [Verrucomicrobiota bacterium]MCH8514070.1 ABC transporter ATP-binding protein [Kiritimatiellia bacterium]
MPVLEIENLEKIYHVSSVMEVAALRGVSLSFDVGEFAAIMGPSGSGKSTLLNVLGCLDQPSGGRYTLNGEEVASLSAERLADVRNSRIGFVFQSFNLLSRTSALENIELPLMYNREGLSMREIRKRATVALERVGLADRADHHPSQLSGGQQQRIAIARALVNQPDVLLADEPTGNLDTRTSLEIMEVFQELNEQGILLIMVTHEPEIGAFTKRVIDMRDGRVERDRQVEKQMLAGEALKKLPLPEEEKS